MDTTRAILYRTFTLNDESINDNTTGGGATGTGIAGCVVDSVDMEDIDIVQWLEKRAQRDGMDAGDVSLGARRIRMSGTLYEKSRPLLFDQLRALRAALNPILAQREEPGDKGYVPLYFTWPTADLTNYPTGVIDLQIKALPRAFGAITDRDQLGGADGDALAIPWQATFICRDPVITAVTPVDLALTAGTQVTSGVTGANATDLWTKTGHGLNAGDRITFYAKTGGSGVSLGVAYYVLASGLTADAFKLSLTPAGATLDLGSDVTAASYVKSVTDSGTWTNRGTYLGVFNAVIEVGAGAGSIVASVGDSIFTITVPASTVNRIIRLKGDDGLLTVEESDTEVSHPDWISFANDTTWPRIDPGDTPYSITCHGMAGVVTGSHVWFYEAYA